MDIRLNNFRRGSSIDSLWISAFVEGEESVPSQQLQYYFLLDLEEQNIKGDWLNHHFPQQHRHM